MPTLKTLLELARISNLPTVWSNTLVGVVAGVYVAGHSSSKELEKSLHAAWPLMASMSLLYIGGMILNDVVDAKVDAKERPKRPIPSGRIQRPHAFALALACLAGGLGILIAAHSDRPLALTFGATLTACIVVYNLLHTHAKASVMLMGTCRGLLVLTCAAASGNAFGQAPLICASALTVYTIGLSLVARGETAVPGTPRLIMGLIAAMCLLDGVFLWGMGQHNLILFAVGCFVLTTLAHRRILGS